MQFLVGLFVGMALMLLIIGLCNAAKGGMPDAEEMDVPGGPE